jgi:hypothetical protein
MSCIFPDCSCEGRRRSDWPMADSPASFFPIPIRRPRQHAPDRFVEESLAMVVLGVE